jgi:ATP-dependent Clp protease, protease subunit
MTMPSFPPEFPGDPARPSPPGGPSWPMPQGPPGESSRPGQAEALGEMLLAHRIILATGDLDGVRAAELCGKLLTLAAVGEEPVILHLRTPDGELPAAFAVADTVGAVPCPVHVVVAGHTGGPPLAVLAAAPRREMTPHATVRLTEPRAELSGDADVVAGEQEHRRLVDAFYVRLAESTGREVDEIRADAREGRLLTADEAVAYGLVQSVAVRP